MSIQSNNSDLNYLIDLIFIKVNRLFLLSFARITRKNDTAKDYRDSFSRHHVPSVEIKDLNF